MKKINRNGYLKLIIARIIVLILAIYIEILLLADIIKIFMPYFLWAENILRIFAFILALNIMRYSRHLSSDLLYILLIIITPVFGALLFIICSLSILLSKRSRELVSANRRVLENAFQNKEFENKMIESYPNEKGLIHYISDTSKYPIYPDRGSEYYSLGDDVWPIMLAEIRKAEKYIFLEYFIIEEGIMWDSILTILKEKAKEGVDIRIIYDDMGSLMTLPAYYWKKLQTYNIKAFAFNRVNPILSLIMNNRDHRKMLIIDGKVAFTGGINLADEYINKKVKHGHWKDNGIKIKGEAVNTFVKLFLSTYDAITTEKDDFNDYLYYPDNEIYENSNNSYLAPYGDTPLDNENTALNIYLNIINEANDYCYIMTPYLIIDTEMINALILAAKRGVDIKIFTPGIPDKKIIYAITQSYYDTLLSGGVKIYEYTPGFIHSKVFLSDDQKAVVGSINLDYRSLYLHFENAVFLSHCKAITDIKNDFIALEKQCKEIYSGEYKHGHIYNFIISILRIFAPLL